MQPYLATMPRLILMDVGFHLVDTARYLLGEIATVTATTGRFGLETAGEDVAMLSLRFAGGALGSLDLSWCTPPDGARPEWALNPTVLEGTEGTVRLQTDGSLEWIGLDGRRERKLVTLPPADQIYVDGYAATQRHFIEGLLTGAEHETRGADNLQDHGRPLGGLPIGRGGADGAGLIATGSARSIASRGRSTCPRAARTLTWF